MRILKLFINLLTLLIVLNGTMVMAKDRTPEAKGIKAGNFILHPGATLGLGYDVYDDNDYFSSDGLVDVGLHFKTRLDDDELYSWDNNLAFNWLQYWGFSYFGDANGGPKVRVSSSADLFKKSLVRLTPTVSYNFDSEAEDSNQNSIPINHKIHAGTYISFQPGEGAVFSERIGYHFNATLYQHAASISFFEHQVDSVTRWNFLPQTHMTLTADFRYVDYMRDTRRTNTMEEAGNQRENPTGYPVRIRYALGGLLTPRLSYELGAGYTYIHYKPNDPVHSWLLNAMLRYDIRSNIGLKLDYNKDFENSSYADFYNYHRVMLTFDALWFDKLQTQLSAGYGYYDYQTNYESNANIAKRQDHLISADAEIYYNFMRGLRLGVTYRYRQNFTNLDDDGGYAKGDYSKHRLMLQFGYEY